MLNNNSEVSRKKLYDEYEESLFKLVMNDVAEKEGKLLLDQNQLLNEEPEYMPTKEAINKFSKRLETEIKKNLKEQNKFKKARRFNRTVLVAIIIVTTLIIATFSVQAFRSGLFNFLVNIESEFASFQLKDKKTETKSENSIDNLKNTYVPTYIPSEFEVNNITNKESLKKIKFISNKNKSLFINYYEHNKTSSFIVADSENSSLVKNININGNEGSLILKESLVTITWEYDNKIYMIETNLGIEEAVKIAENVRFIK